MRHVKGWGTRLLLVGLLTGACLADDAAPPKFYKLDFVVKEVEGLKVVNGRTYSVIASKPNPNGFVCSIRTGDKVPYSTGEKYNYLDVGVSIDCMNLKEVPNGLSLEVHADISSVAPEPTKNADHPLVRQNKWSSIVLVPLKKPTVIFSSDDLTSKHQMQLELTATPIT